VENLLLTQDFTSLQNENKKTVSGLLPVQFVSPMFVCIVGLQHKSVWMGFLTELISRLTGAYRLDGARSKMQVDDPIFEPEVFWKQMYCIEEGTCVIVGIFWCPRNHLVQPQ